MSWHQVLIMTGWLPCHDAFFATAFNYKVNKVPAWKTLCLMVATHWEYSAASLSATPL
jgi:hypothetical protein